MVELTDRQIDTALERGAANRASEPRATSVRFNVASERLVIELSNGCTFALPSRLIEGLADATADQMKRVEVLGSGYGLHWPDLDSMSQSPVSCRGYSEPAPTWPALRGEQNPTQSQQRPEPTARRADALRKNSA